MPVFLLREDRLARTEAILSDRLSADTDSPYVTTAENFFGWEHADMYEAVQSIDPGRIRLLAQTYNDIAALVPFGLGAAFLKSVVHEGWEGRAADRALDMIELLGNQGIEFRDSIGVIAVKLHRVHSALDSIRTAVPPPEVATPIALSASAQQASDESCEEARQAAARALTNLYSPAYREAGTGVPTLRGPDTTASIAEHVDGAAPIARALQPLRGPTEPTAPDTEPGQTSIADTVDVGAHDYGDSSIDGAVRTAAYRLPSDLTPAGYGSSVDPDAGVVPTTTTSMQTVTHSTRTSEYTTVHTTPTSAASMPSHSGGAAPLTQSGDTTTAANAGTPTPTHSAASVSRSAFGRPGGGPGVAEARGQDGSSRHARESNRVPGATTAGAASGAGSVSPPAAPTRPAGASGGHLFAPGMRPASPASDTEHKTPGYLVSVDNGNQLIGHIAPVGPPVIG